MEILFGLLIIIAVTILVFAVLTRKRPFTSVNYTHNHSEIETEKDEAKNSAPVSHHSYTSAKNISTQMHECVEQNKAKQSSTIMEAIWNQARFLNTQKADAQENREKSKDFLISDFLEIDCLFPKLKPALFQLNDWHDRKKVKNAISFMRKAIDTRNVDVFFNWPMNSISIETPFNVLSDFLMGPTMEAVSSEKQEQALLLVKRLNQHFELFDEAAHKCIIVLQQLAEFHNGLEKERALFYCVFAPEGVSIPISVKTEEKPVDASVLTSVKAGENPDEVSDSSLVKSQNEEHSEMVATTVADSTQYPLAVHHKFYLAVVSQTINLQSGNANSFEKTCTKRSLTERIYANILSFERSYTVKQERYCTNGIYCKTIYNYKNNTN